MNPYILLTSHDARATALELRTRLTAWHDAMVQHERRLRNGLADESCDDDCAHADARLLWAEAVSVFGPRAHELTFLQSRAAEAT
jgi:hypothetical protein